MFHLNNKAMRKLRIKNVKNLFASFVMCLAMAITSNYTFADETVQPPDMGDDCTTFGYKIWDDPGVFGNKNFYDCLCNLRRGKNPQAC
jgi:hypothetical protein